MSRIAISESDNRVAPLFDVSRRLVLCDCEKGECLNRERLALAGETAHQRARELAAHGIEVLLCGAVSPVCAAAVEARGIQIIPFRAGDVAEALAAYLSGGIESPLYAMPGVACRRERGGRGRRRRRACGGNGPWRGGRI